MRRGVTFADCYTRFAIRSRLLHVHCLVITLLLPQTLFLGYVDSVRSARYYWCVYGYAPRLPILFDFTQLPVVVSLPRVTFARCYHGYSFTLTPFHVHTVAAYVATVTLRRFSYGFVTRVFRTTTRLPVALLPRWSFVTVPTDPFTHHRSGVYPRYVDLLPLPCHTTYVAHTLRLPLLVLMPFTHERFRWTRYTPHTRPTLRAGTLRYPTPLRTFLLLPPDLRLLPLFISVRSRRLSSTPHHHYTWAVRHVLLFTFDLLTPRFLFLLLPSRYTTTTRVAGW